MAPISHPAPKGMQGKSPGNEVEWPIEIQQLVQVKPRCLSPTFFCFACLPTTEKAESVRRFNCSKQLFPKQNGNNFNISLLPMGFFQKVNLVCSGQDFKRGKCITTNTLKSVSFFSSITFFLDRQRLCCEVYQCSKIPNSSAAREGLLL